MKRQKNKTRLIAVIIAACLLAVSSPVSSFAEGTGNEESETKFSYGEDTESDANYIPDNQKLNSKGFEETKTKITYADDSESEADYTTNALTMNMFAALQQDTLPEGYVPWKIDGQDREFNSLSEAISASEDGDTIRALRSSGLYNYVLLNTTTDATVTISRNLVIDFNGCYDRQPEGATYTDGHSYIIGNGVDCTFRNGIIYAWKGDGSTIYGRSGARLKMSNCQVITTGDMHETEVQGYFIFNNKTFASGENSASPFKLDMMKCKVDDATGGLLDMRTYFCTLVGDNTTATVMDSMMALYSSNLEGSTHSKVTYCGCRVVAAYIKMPANGTEIRMVEDCDVTAGFLYYDSYKTGLVLGGGKYFQRYFEVKPGSGYSRNLIRTQQSMNSLINTDRYAVNYSWYDNNSGLYIVYNKKKNDYLQSRNSIVSSRKFDGGTYSFQAESIEEILENPYEGDTGNMKLNRDIMVCGSLNFSGDHQIDLNGYLLQLPDAFNGSLFVLNNGSKLDIYDSTYYSHMEDKTVINGNKETQLFKLNGGELNISNIRLNAGNDSTCVINATSGISVINTDNTDMYYSGESTTGKSLINTASGAKSTWNITDIESTFRGFENIASTKDGDYIVIIDGGRFYTNFTQSSAYDSSKVVLQPGCYIEELTDEDNIPYWQVSSSKSSYVVLGANDELLSRCTAMSVALETVPENGTIRLMANADSSNDASLKSVIQIKKSMTIDLNNHNLTLIREDPGEDIPFIVAKPETDKTYLNLIIKDGKRKDGKLIIGYSKPSGGTVRTVRLISAEKTNAQKVNTAFKNVGLSYDESNYSTATGGFSTYAADSGNFDSLLFSGVHFTGFSAVEHGAGDAVSGKSRYVNVSFGSVSSEVPENPVGCLISNENGHGYCNAVLFDGDFTELGSLTKTAGGNISILGGTYSTYPTGSQASSYIAASDYEIQMIDNTVTPTVGYSHIRFTLADKTGGKDIQIAAKDKTNPEQYVIDEYMGILTDGDKLTFTGPNENLVINLNFADSGDLICKGKYFVDMNGHGTAPGSDSTITASGKGVKVEVTNSALSAEDLLGNGNAFAGTGNLMSVRNDAKLDVSRLILSSSGGSAVYAETNGSANVENVIFKGCSTDITVASPSEIDSSKVTVEGEFTSFGFSETAEKSETFFSGKPRSVEITGGRFARLLTDDERMVASFEKGCGLVPDYSPFTGRDYYIVKRNEFPDPEEEEYDIDPGDDPWIEGEDTETEDETDEETDIEDYDDIIIIIDDVTGRKDVTGGGVTNGGTTKNNSGTGSTKKSFIDFGSGGGGSGSGGSGGGGSGSGGSGGGGGSGSGGGGAAGGPGGETAENALPAAAPASQGTSSPNWFAAADGTWKIKNSAGQVVTNAWVCDDVVPANGQNVWYLIGPAGAMVTAGLVRDPSGQMYSIETDKTSPYYGMLRYKNGYYNCNGKQVYLEFSQVHDATFGKIINPDGIAMLQAIYGITDYNISSSQNVHTASF